MALLRFIGVTRRRHGLLPTDLSALDGVRGGAVSALALRKTRTPRRLKVLPVRRTPGRLRRRNVLIPF